MNHAYICDISKIEDDVYTIELSIESNQKITFHPGQYLLIFNQFQKWTPYSISSCPSSDRIKLIIKENYEGENIKYLSNIFNLNNPIKVSLPHGSAYPRTSDFQDFICVANGMGIVPVKSILDNFITNSKKGRLFLFWFLKPAYLESMVAYFNEVRKQHSWFAVNYFYSENCEDKMSDLYIKVKNGPYDSATAQFLLYGSKEFVYSTNKLLESLHYKNIDHDYTIQKKEISYA